MQAEETTKRKRGRPNASNASKAAPTAPEPEQDNTNDPGSRPTKRRRQSKENAEPEAVEAQPARRRPRRSGDNAAEEEAPRQKRRRGEKEPAEEETRAEGDKKKKKNVLKARSGTATADEQQGEQSKRGRPKAGRPPLQDKAPNTNAQGKTRRGRPSAAAAAAAEENPASPPQKKKRGRPSKGGDEEPANRHNTTNDDDQEPTRPSRPKQQRTEAPPPLPPKRYLHVAPHVRGVKQATIDAKWTPLASSSIAAASEILELAHRPVAQRMAGTTQRRQHASAALSVAYRRITRKLQRGLPFPPAGMPSSAGTAARGGGDGGRETELDFESVLDGRRALERQLDPALHAVELLRREKGRMERELERDYMTLRNLEAGARTQAREQREKLKRAHVLAPDASRKPHLEDVEMLFEDDGPISQGNTFKVSLFRASVR